MKYLHTNTLHINTIMERPTVILFVGNVKKGKSSAINALAGAFITNPSKQRETFQPIHFNFTNNSTDKSFKNISETMENDHKQNEKKRLEIKTLKESDIAEPILCSHNLPLLNGMKPYKIIDTGGLEDADDMKDMLFSKVVYDNISKADLIVFVSEALTLFNETAEVKQFETIKKLIEIEKLNGHYVELCVLVNKFDDEHDKDLNEIYDKITKKYSTDKFFRFSSHESLIHNVKENGLNLYIPEFMKKEAECILKTSNIRITSNLKKELKTNNYISSDNLEYDETVSTGLDDVINPTNTNHSGDWDHFVLYLVTFQKELKNNIAKIIETKLVTFINTCEIVRTQPGPYFMEYNIVHTEFRKIHGRIKRDHIDFGLFFNNHIKKMFDMQHNYTDKLLFSIFDYLHNMKHTTLISDIFDKICETKIWLEKPFLQYYVYKVATGNLIYITRDKYCKLFSLSGFFKQCDAEFYDYKRNKMYNSYDYVVPMSNIGIRPKPIILYNLLHNSKTSDELRILLLLSLTPVRMIKHYNINGHFPTELFDSIYFAKHIDVKVKSYSQPNASVLLMYYIDTLIEVGKGDMALHNILFNIRECTLIFDRCYTNYLKIFDSLKKVD